MAKSTGDCSECGWFEPTALRRGLCIPCYSRRYRHGTHVEVPKVGRNLPPPPPQKACTICKIVKPLEEFSSNGKRRDGRTSHCKECRRERYYVRAVVKNVDKPPTAGGEKRCLTCKFTRPEEQFTWLKHRATRKETCTVCESDRIKKLRVERPEIFRDRQLRHKYGISLTEFEALLDKQGGACAICLTTVSSRGKSLAVDHCHDSKAVRGILCLKCNAAIGLLRDDPDLLTRGAEYLRGR